VIDAPAHIVGAAQEAAGAYRSVPPPVRHNPEVLVEARSRP
jgi:hypothetical protein